MFSARHMVSASRAADRIAAARAWLEALKPGSEALLIAPSQESADDLLRAVAASKGALFAIHRLTFNRLIGLLAAEEMAAREVAPAAGLAAEAVVARTVFKLGDDERIACFGDVIKLPGFPGALARTLQELRLNRIGPDALEILGVVGRALATILRQFQNELLETRLIDRAGTIELAIAAIRSTGDCRFAAIPTLVLDVPLDGLCERDLLAALASKTPSILATVPANDLRSKRFLADALAINPDEISENKPPAGDESSLMRLQHYLFAESNPPERALDDSVTLLSAPGEMQECVEIARRVQACARRGVPFDQIAIFLHVPARYSSHLAEALNRADVPAYFARGTAKPEPGGRAMLALLACAAENLSARRFAEYLSLAQVPEPDDTSGTEPFVAAAADLAASAMRDDLQVASPDADTEPPGNDPVPVVEGTLRAPWRWERELVEAAVIGSRDRWLRRLDGLEAELKLRRSELEDDDAHARAFERRLLDLEHLREVALPIIDKLAALPREASWAEWLSHLRELVQNAVRDREPVLTALAELEPMGPVGPVGLDEVRMVLADRLGYLEEKPRGRRYGAVFVAPTTYARGLDFEVTMIPGLAERVFPKKLTEDPVLPDALRRTLSPALALQSERVGAERLALRLAVGGARSETALSYPRVDLDQGRPRVPSFYALEILRAAEGRLPGFDELARRAAGERQARLGWPVPDKAQDAIDNVEFDLAVLDKLVDADPDTTIGAAHYLLDANPHLGRALRARARRWLSRWTPNDGLVDPQEGARAALARHRLAARSYSPTALQNFAACPYRFFLQAIFRLEPREEIKAIEVIDPLTRGALFHEVQFEVLTALRESNRLPLDANGLDEVYAVLDAKLEEVAERYHDELAPAIERVWDDGIDSIRADLREWIRRAAENGGEWTPYRFELAFGLSKRPHADPASTAEAVALECGLNLRGSIDLVERDSAGVLRITDHKTGRARTNRNLVIGGGKTLQPLLYALAAERILGDQVAAGRLYYCTAAGGYEERVVALDKGGRTAVADFASTIADALDDAFLPAAPGVRECDYCDYRKVCGPYETIRVAQKPATRLKSLDNLRKKP